MPKVIQSIKNQFNFVLRRLIHFRPHGIRWRSFENYIKRLSFINRVGFTSSVALFIISLLIIFPIYYKTQLAEAAGSLSDTALSITSDNLTAGVELLVTSDSGTFASTASGDEMSFSVTTNNVTGYMLSISAKSGTDLTNSAADTSFTSLSTANGIDATTFDTTTYNNQWGFKPNYYKSTANNDKFYPSPTTSGVTLNKTDSANANADTYTITIGARATYSQPAGAYSNTYILSAVGNYPKYSITYVDNSGDSTLANMPSPNPQTTPLAIDVKIALSSTEPTRTGYTFAGWCTANNSGNTSACNGTTYAAGADFPLSTLSANTTNLYAIWTVNQYDCVKQYRLQGADSNYPTSYITDTTEKVNYGATCSYSKSETGYTTQSASGTMTDSGLVLQVSLPRAEYSVKVNFAGSGVSSVSFAASGWATKSVTTSGDSVSLAYDVQYTMTMNLSSTSYAVDSFALNSSSYGTLRATASGSSVTSTTVSPSYFTPTNSSSAIITATGKFSCATTVSGTMQDFNPCSTVANGTSGSLTDSRDNQIYTVKKINDQWWMTRNLAIGCNGSGSSYGSSISSKQLAPADSNISAAWATPTKWLSAASSSTQTADYSTGRMQCSSTYGAWYNYYAASAGTISTNSNTTVATSSICPLNWKLPTGPNTTSGTDFNKLVGNTTGGWQDPTDGLKAFGPVAGGTYSNGSLYNTGSGLWWSATANSATGRYLLRYSSSDGQFDGNDSNLRYFGSYVRCVRS